MPGPTYFLFSLIHSGLNSSYVLLVFLLLLYLLIFFNVMITTTVTTLSFSFLYFNNDGI